MASTAGQHRCYGGGTRRQQECRRWCLNVEAAEAESRQNECWGLEHPQSFSFTKVCSQILCLTHGWLPPTASPPASGRCCGRGAVKSGRWGGRNPPHRARQPRSPQILAVERDAARGSGGDAPVLENADKDRNGVLARGNLIILGGVG